MSPRPTPGPNPTHRSHWLRGPCAWLAFVVPLLVTLTRLAPGSQWRDDVALVRGLGFVPVGGEGVVSSVLAQVASLLPLGGRLLRASIPSALAAACAGALVFHFALRVLDKNAPARRLGPLLALLAAWSSSLSGAWQAEATVAGGATLAAVLMLLAVHLRFQFRLESRGWAVYGAVTGLALVENRTAGLACLAFLAADAALLRQLPTLRELGHLVAGVLAVVGVGLLPFLIQPLSGGVWTDMGSELSRLAGGSRAAGPNTFQRWHEALGDGLLWAALAGAVWGVSRPRIRPWLLPLFAFPLLEIVLPGGADPSGLRAAASAPVGLVALAVLVVAAALLVHTLAFGLDRRRLPFAKPAQVLLLVFSLTLVLVVLEDSGRRTEAQAQTAAETWTDEALGSLPARSLVMVRSEPAAFRLWAARVTRGQRPDLTIVPLSLLDRGDVSARLLTLEPQLAPLIRELRVSGKPSEYALSSLADARPLYVEFDPSWDSRLLEHVLPHPFWLEFAPHALGRSDRVRALSQSKQAFSRVAAVASGPPADVATVSMLSDCGREQAVMLASLGDRESAAAVVEQLSVLPGERGFVQAMQEELGAERRGVDWLALLQ